MIMDLISRLPLYESLIPGAGQVAAAFLSQDPGAAPFEVREKAYALRDDSRRRFEVHGRTVDLMMAREGAEVIHICPQALLAPAEPLPGGADGRKLDGGPQGTAALLEAGCFCAIFPGEAHMVGGRICGGEGSVAKWVVKVPCPRALCTEEEP